MTCSPTPIDLEALDALANRASGQTISLPIGGALPEFIATVAQVYPLLSAELRVRRWEVERLKATVKELADDLEAEVQSRAHAQLARTTKRDMAPVVEARALLAHLDASK